MSQLKIKTQAMNLLARREHSQLELYRKLQVRGYNNDLINDTIEELIKEDLQSDERFAENYIRSRMRRGFGPIRIALELRERGVDQDIIEKLVDKHNEKWQKLAMEVKRKKFGEQKMDAKQIRFMQYRGFPLMRE